VEFKLPSRPPCGPETLPVAPVALLTVPPSNCALALTVMQKTKAKLQIKILDFIP
jgi:hypothetical protein